MSIWQLESRSDGRFVGGFMVGEDKDAFDFECKKPLAQLITQGAKLRRAAAALIHDLAENPQGIKNAGHRAAHVARLGRELALATIGRKALSKLDELILGIRSRRTGRAGSEPEQAVVIGTTTAWLPWELMYLADIRTDDDFDFANFLGHNWVCARQSSNWLDNGDFLPAERPKVLGLFDHDEAELMEYLAAQPGPSCLEVDVLNRLTGSTVSKQQSFHNKLSQFIPDIIHAGCHCDYDAPTLHISDGFGFKPADILASDFHRTGCKPFWILNGCQTAQDSNGGGYGFASAFLDDDVATGLLVTELPVTAEIAGAMTGPVYDAWLGASGHGSLLRAVGEARLQRTSGGFHPFLNEFARMSYSVYMPPPLRSRSGWAGGNA